MDESSVKTAALKAQRRTIFRLMLTHYVGDRCQIAKWDDFRYSISLFAAGSVLCGMPYSRIRRHLDRMAQAGDLERHQIRVGTPIGYRLPRIVCDAFAAEAISHYQAIGYSQDEIRSEFQE